MLARGARTILWGGEISPLNGLGMGISATLSWQNRGRYPLQRWDLPRFRCIFVLDLFRNNRVVLLSDALSCNMQIVNKMGLKFQQNLLKVDTNIVLYQNLVKDTILQI